MYRNDSTIKRQKSDKTGTLSFGEIEGKSKWKTQIWDWRRKYMTKWMRKTSNIILKHQRNNWIGDDGKGGYIEDRKQIFDDDLTEENIPEAKKETDIMIRKKREKEHRKREAIQTLIRNMPSRRGSNTVTKDDILRVAEWNICK